MNVSVIIPCYNAEEYIAQTIGSVLEQSEPPSQIIVVDDRSDDQSRDIARRFGSPVQVISKRCGGGSKARNYGYRFATGDAIMFLDADDVLGPHALENLRAALEDGGIAICPWYRLEKQGNQWMKGPADCKAFRASMDHLANWLTGWWHPPCSVLWSRSAFERTGGWDQRAYVNDDGELVMRALVAGTPMTLSTQGAAFYRRLPEEQTSVSDRRFTRAGIKSRIYAARKIALLLEQEKKLDDYRPALREKFEEISADCLSTFPELHKRCLEYADKYGEPLWRRRLRREGKTAVRRLVPQRLKDYIKRCLGRPDQLVGGQSERQEINDSVQIRYGLTSASRVQQANRPSGIDESRHPVSSADPEVSVIIPTYNRAALIGRAIDSVLSQTFQDFEIIVVDDGSTDETFQVIDRLDDDRVRYIVQPQNRGVAAARNRGMRDARGTFIAFLDSDDEWFPAKLEKQVACFRSASGQVGLVYCGVETKTRDGSMELFTPSRRGKLYHDLLLDNPIHSGSSTMIRRDVLQVAGFFNEDIPAHEDYDYWLRIARFFQFDFVDEPLVRYYDVDGINRKTLQVRKNLAARNWFYKKYSHEMRRAGVDYLFLVETVRWYLTWAEDRPGAFRSLLRALARNPLRPEAYCILPRVVLPEQVYWGFKDLPRTSGRVVRRLLSSSR